MHIFHKRQGQMDDFHVYFYTETIYEFHHLLQHDEYKLIVIESLQWLVKSGLVTIYAYVIMPNHIHLLWRVEKMNGKENPAGSFAKFTAHQFKKKLERERPQELITYAVQKSDRSFQFWKRDPLAIPLLNEKIFYQRMKYIHDNPMREKWSLCKWPEDYRWSSARFYKDGYDEFGILTNCFE
jgi:REP element-mobilizing transposase RayT